jgi:acyl dehydratase
MWFEDFHVGDHLESGDEIEITAEGIIAFARAYDPQPAHLGEPGAAVHLSALAASGWHTAAITMRLLTQLGVVGPVGLEVNLTWPTPARPGDRLRVEVVVTSKRESNSKPDRGIVELRYDTVNQFGEVRQRTRAMIMAWRRRSTASWPGARTAL